MDYYLRAVVAYDGTDFRGFQIQGASSVPGTRTAGQRPRAPVRDVRALRTVQGVLEEALEQITKEPVRLVGAGRTDAGVHALGQVVAFATHWRHPLPDLFRAWNAVLPDDVAILSLCQAQRGFHPRFDATSRAYRYTIWNHPVRNPLLRRTALWEPRELEVPTMAAALELLVGEHDFATFGRSPGARKPTSVGERIPMHPMGGQRGTTVRRILTVNAYRRQSMDINQYTDNRRASASAQYARCTVDIDIEANAFLYRMVRSIVGTVLQVGRGDLSIEQFASVFASRDRSQAGPTAPPHGLCLMAVNY